MKNKGCFRTDVLFAKSNYITGAGSILSLGGNYYKFNSSPAAKDADLKALSSDWGVVGSDFTTAMKIFKMNGKNSSRIHNYGRRNITGRLGERGRVFRKA